MIVMVNVEYVITHVETTTESAYHKKNLNKKVAFVHIQKYNAMMNVV